MKYGPKPLAELVTHLVAPACRKRGVAHAALMIDPAEIFGERFARSASVEKIVWPADGEGGGATLVVRAEAAAALALQHVAPQVIERVNIVIGWPAVARLRLTQTRGRSVRPRRTVSQHVPPPPPDPAIAAAVAAEVGEVEHAQLKAALTRLGARVQERGLSRRSKRP